MNCADFEILLCDYIDATLDSAQRSEFEKHMHECAACGEFASDAMGAVAFIGRAEEVVPPPQLLTRIAFAIPAGRGTVKGARSWMSGWLQPIFQPRFAMGMAMTILSFSMLGRFAGVEVRQLKPSDLSPTRVLAAADDKVHRTWQRALKYYDSLRVVYEVQTQLKEWTEQEDNQPVTQPPVNQPGKQAPNGSTKSNKGPNPATEGKELR